MRCEVDRWRPIRFMMIAMFQAGSNPKLTLRPFSSRTRALAQLFKHQSIGGAESLHVSLQTLRPHSWGGVWGTQSQSMMYWQMTLTWRFTFCHLLFKSWMVFYHVCQGYQNVEIELMQCISRDIYPAKARQYQQFDFSHLFRSHDFPTESLPLFLWQLLTLKVGHKSGKSWADCGAKALKFWGGEWICLHILGCFWKDGGSDARSIPDICCYTFHRCLPEHGGWSFRPRSRVAKWHHVAIASQSLWFVQHNMGCLDSNGRFQSFWINQFDALVVTAMQAHRDMTWDKVFAAADMDKPGAWCIESASWNFLGKHFVSKRLYITG